MNVGQELNSFFSAALQSAPFMVLAVLAYSGARRSSFKVFTLAWLVILLGAFALVTFGLTFAGVADMRQIAADPGRAGIFTPALLRALALAMVGIVAGLACAALAFLPPVRRALARRLPLQADDFVHAVALSAVLGLAVMCFTPLLAVGDAPLLVMLRTMPDDALSLNSGVMTRAELYSLAWLVPCALLAVGLGVKRNLRQTLARLGLIRPSLRQVALGVGVAVALVIAMRGMDVAMGAVWTTMGWPRTDEATFNRLLSFAMNPASAVVVAVVAGLGEELAVRGVLQPRLGVLLPNVFFASLHAFQYHWDGVLQVFIIGLVLGLLRRRSSTSVSAIAHGGYDLILLAIGILSGTGT